MNKLTIWRPARNRIYCMDAFLFLRSLPTNSVNCVVTSPPYFGLRDYGVTGQIGLEPTPDQFVATMVALFREARRVLREDGVCWLNIGDSYWNSAFIRSSSSGAFLNKGDDGYDTFYAKAGGGVKGGKRRSTAGLPAKNLLGIPWRVALALQADGWILRSDVIWSKPNPMPESVTDRPTKAHEYCFLLTKSGRYWWDAEAVREPNAGIMPYGDKRNFKMNEAGAQGRHGKTSLFAGGSKEDYIAKYYINGRNLRTVWEVATEPTPFAHFATFPRKLIEPMIKAGCPKGGLVLDPFMGSGTTGLVARSLGRDYVGCDLNPEYVKLAQSRLELPLLDLVEQPEFVAYQGAGQ